MKNYMDYLWRPENVYKVFSLRRLITDVYGLDDTNVFPISVDTISCIEKVREGRTGELYVRFNSLVDYATAFRCFSARRDTVMVKDTDYNKFVQQYRNVVEVPLNKENAKIYAEPSSACIYLPNSGYVLTVDIYYANGFYTQHNIDVNDKTYEERKDVYAIRDEWLNSLDDSYSYLKEQTENIDAIARHITDISNSYEGQLRLFKHVVDNNKNNGFKMCLYKVHYLNSKKTTFAWAYEPEQLFNRLEETMKDKVSGIDTVVVCECDFEVGYTYKIVFAGGRESTFVFKDMKQFSDITSHFVNRNYRFKIVQY